MVVVGDPGVDSSAPLGGGLVGAGVGPLAQAGLDEALGLAVGARRVGPGADMLEAGLGTGRPGVKGPVGRAVVGHDAFDGDAETGEPIERAAEESDGAFLLLVWQKLGVGQARGVVDADVQHLPADAVVAIDGSGTAAGNAVADAPHGA